jgi:hypothetical protein
METFIDYVSAFCIYPEEYLVSRTPNIATPSFPLPGINITGSRIRGLGGECG